MRTAHVSEEIYTHEYLWRSVEVLVKLAASEERRLYLDISCLTMAYLAFEAFVNFIGEIIRPDLWAEEKTAFRGQGDAIEAKLAAIVERLGYEWRKGEQLYQHIKRLKAFRDLVAHGKVVRSEYVTPMRDDGTHIRWTHEWDDFVEPPAVRRALQAITDFSESLLVEARKHYDEPHLAFKAFSGSLGSAEGTSTLE
jgi:hypothetical protein